MNTARKIEIETLPQDYSPSTLPEIMKLAKKITGDAALVYERLNKPFFMETDRLIIRRFTAEDAEAVLALSLDRMNSSMKNFDHQWPTDLEGCKGAVAWFAGNDTSYAVCLKPSMKLIGYISYNSVNDDGVLDLGHVWHTAHQDNSLDTEALSLMTQYAFEKLGVNGVTAGNPLDCEEQIAPLKTIGMEIVETREKASFVNDENGNSIEFTGVKMLITKEQWDVGNPESFSPKNKPEILEIVENTNNAAKMDTANNADAMPEPRIISKTLNLVGVKGKITDWSNFEPILNEHYKTVNSKLDAIQGILKPARMVGFWHMDALPSGEREYCYFAGVEADTDNVPDGLVVKTLPESHYAVFTEYKRGTIGGSGGYGYKWIQSSSDYEPNGEIPGDFEIYMNMNDITSESEAEILIPIQPKGKKN
jgi:RimJ/RimL family protein N-acetyltransferase